MGQRPPACQVPEASADVVVTLRPGQRLIVRYAEEDRAPANDARSPLTLEELAPMASISVRSLRALIKRGKLAARRLGRSYVVEREDAERLLRPTLATPSPRAERLSPAMRERRQLEAAGISFGGAS